MKLLVNFALIALFLFIGCGEAKPPPQLKIVTPQVNYVNLDKAGLVAFIKQTNPQIRPSDANHIADTLISKAKEYNIDLKRFASVVAQESHFRLNLKSCYEVRSRTSNEYFTQCDLGLGQVSPVWIHQLKLDPNRLQYDIHYSLDAVAQILKHYKDRYPKDPLSFSRYYNGRPSLRRDYEKRVHKHHSRLVAMVNTVNSPMVRGIGV